MTLFKIYLQVEMTDMGKKESITIDTEAGERSDLGDEVLNITRMLFS